VIFQYLEQVEVAAHPLQARLIALKAKSHHALHVPQLDAGAIRLEGRLHEEVSQLAYIARKAHELEMPLRSSRESQMAKAVLVENVSGQQRDVG